jgi:hypothetical protein
MNSTGKEEEIMKSKFGAAVFAMLAVGAIALNGCSSDSSSSASGSGTDTGIAASVSDAYPSSLAVASPFETMTTGGASVKGVAKAGSSFTTAYDYMISTVSSVLSGSSGSLCTFDPQMFLAKPGHVDCYGPTLNYEDHPDGTIPNSGQLPSGDLGIWTETESSTGEACAAAELNSQMEGVSYQALASMTSVASLVCNAYVNGVWPPAAGSTIDLMDPSLTTPLSVERVSFNTAKITLDSTGAVWVYDLDFDYTDTASAVHNIVVQLSHEGGTGGGKGRFTYIVGDTFTGGNCPTSDVTVNGSLVYDATSGTSINLQSRAGTYCGSGAVGIDGSGLADPSYTQTSYADGWGNNFTVFTADFDPANIAGQYSYKWQAGSGDSNARILNVTVNNTDPMDGEAWSGFGAQVWDTTSCIQGFYCAWAGPGYTHTMSDYVQRQHVTLNAVTGVVEPTNSAASDITYAPTNSCTYDGSGTFKYDRDMDGDLTDETAATNVVTDPATTGLEFDLYEAQDVNGDGNATVCEAMQARGYSAPAIPTYANPYTGPTHP